MKLRWYITRTQGFRSSNPGACGAKSYPCTIENKSLQYYDSKKKKWIDVKTVREKGKTE